EQVWKPVENNVESRQDHAEHPAEWTPGRGGREQGSTVVPPGRPAWKPLEEEDSAEGDPAKAGDEKHARILLSRAKRRYHECQHTRSGKHQPQPLNGIEARGRTR